MTEKRIKKAKAPRNGKAANPTHEGKAANPARGGRKERVLERAASARNTFRQKLTKPANRHSVFRNVVKESVKSVLPIFLIVLVLCFTLTPVSNNAMMSFVIGTVLLIIGMGLFNMGAENSLTPLGQSVGKAITNTKKVWLIAFIGFVIGIIITIAEPDLQVLAEQVSFVPHMVLILSVALGVGVFLVIALLRTLLGIPLRILLCAFYVVVFVLAAFVPQEFWTVAFDSGGVTTGPMTVPFILALGVGVSSLRRDKNAADDSFGLVALCSIGPIISVLVLGLIYKASDFTYIPAEIPNPLDTRELLMLFIKGLPQYLLEMAKALAPILAFLILYQIITRKLTKKEFVRILVGMLYTLVGLTLFLTGVNVGFMPVGRLLGYNLASLKENWLLVPVAMLIGYFIVAAEPAVHVLNKQVEEITLGKIPAKAMNLSLSAGIAFSLAIAMIRVLTGVSIIWFIAPLYGVALILSFFVPKIFTAIAFDSGGVASGPMTAAFLVPFAVGACTALGGNIYTDAFGVVAMVAVTPLVAIQILGLVYKIKVSKSAVQKDTAPVVTEAEPVPEDDIIELD